MTDPNLIFSRATSISLGLALQGCSQPPPSDHGTAVLRVHREDMGQLGTTEIPGGVSLP